jgi:hypothetical protein
MANMRIVGMNAGIMFIQKQIKREWIQEVMLNVQFEEMMQKEYAPYWKKYLESGTDKSAEAFFYNYNETDEMQEKGEAFIYKGRDERNAERMLKHLQANQY